MSADDSVEVPLRVTWGTMLQAKLSYALRPARMLLFAAGLALLALGSSVYLDVGFWPLLAQLTGILVPIRLAAMALSAHLDKRARRFDGGILTMRPDGVTVVLLDGTMIDRDWSWVLEARERRAGLQLRLAERRGRMWLWISEHRDSVRALLRAAGKLRAE